MSFAEDKARKSEPLQAVVQSGEVGFYPLNSLAVSALHHGQTNSVIGFQEDSSLNALKTRSELTVGKTVIPIQGKVLGGISDAFYRGKLPEVLVITPSMMEVPAFIEEIMDFFEKLCALGFLSQRQGDETSALDRYIPHLVIASYGVVYDVILQKFYDSFQNMTDISSRQRDRLLQKLLRGVFTSPPEGYDTQLSPLTLFQQPLAINLAGSKSMYTVRTTQILEGRGIPCQFNPNGELGILEWELNLAYIHIIHRILPLLKSAKAPVGVKEKQVTQLFDALGQKLDILPGLVVVVPDSSASPPDVKSLTLSMVDLAILHQVLIQAKRSQLPDLETMLTELIDAVGGVVRQNQPSIAGERA